MNVRYDLPDYFDLDMDNVLHGLGPRLGIMSHLWYETYVYTTTICYYHNLLICFEADKIAHFVFYVEDWYYDCYGILDLFFDKRKGTYTTRFHTITLLESYKGNISKKVKIDGKKYSLYLIYALYVRMIREMTSLLDRRFFNAARFITFEHYFTRGMFKDSYIKFFKPKDLDLYSKLGFNYRTLFFRNFDTEVVISSALSSAEQWKAGECIFFKTADTYESLFEELDAKVGFWRELDIKYLYSFEESNGKSFHMFSVMNDRLCDESGCLLGIEEILHVDKCDNCTYTYQVEFCDWFGYFSRSDVQVFNVKGNEYWILDILIAMKRYAPELDYQQMLNSDLFEEYMQYYKISEY